MGLNKKILISIILVVGIVSTSILVYFVTRPEDINQIIEPNFKGGIITQDETWSGNIFVNESILVQRGLC